MYDPERLIDFVKEKPVWFLWIAASFSSVVAMSCIIGYLSVFDKSLIWLIELNDILKIAVIFSGVIISLFYSMYIYYSVGFKRERSHWSVIVIALIAAFFLLIGVALDLYKNIGNAVFYGLFAYGCYLFYLCLVSFKNIQYDLENIGFVPREGLIPIFFLVFFTAIFGSTIYGLYVRDIMKHQLIVEYEKEKGNVITIENAGIVLMLTHHCVVTSGSKYFILRTPDIIQISGG